MADRILIAADSFKGSATSLEVGQAMAAGVREALPEADVQVFSVADGGEGTVAAFAENATGSLCRTEVLSPDDRLIKAQYFLSADKSYAVIETAQASGLTQVAEDRRQILQLSSYGTGQQIRAALDQGVREIYLGLGGTATNDMGLGIAAALGARFLDRQGLELQPIPAQFREIASLDLSGLDQRLTETAVTLLADVANPLCGPDGASRVFGPQKGASPEETVYPDQALSQVADLIARDYGMELKALKGGGAAGGMGAGLSFFLRAQIRPGIETLLTLARFSKALADANLVLTGEGRLDAQSLAGKVPIGVARLARRFQVPTVALVGSSSEDLTAVYQAGLSAVFPIQSGPMTLDQSMSRTLELAAYASRNVFQFYRTIRQTENSK